MVPPLLAGLRGDSAEPCEGSFAVDPLWVVAGGDEELGGC
jgi:hypothetical protein